MKKARRTTALALVSGAVSVGLLMSGCTPSSGGGEAQGPVSQDQIDEAMTTPTKLTFWTWVPDIENEVKLFEEKYPAIDVTVENVGQGLPHYQKLRSAIEAGEGAPDVAQIEYQYIPSFVLPESLLDLTPYGADDLSGDYVDWAWNQVSPDEEVWAIPQDVGPMGNLYREDILAQAGITEPPATWDEYATAAKAVKDATGSYISNLGATQAGQMIGFFWQAGVKPFGYNGEDTVSINVNSDEAKEVAYVLDRPDPAGPHLHRRRLQRHVVPGPGERQVRRLAHRGMGTDLPAGHRRGHVRALACRAAAAVGGGHRGLGQLGRLVRRGARVE